MSRCTHGFPTLFHIDKVAGKDDLDTLDGRQVLIPDINFGCNGSIIRFIVGARWEGNIEAYTELQIWRRISEGQYMKVNGTSIMVSGENTSQVYELETSLAFQEGDILGYFQPRSFRSQLDLYMEDSEKLITHYTKLIDLLPPATGAVFSVDGVNEDTRYPLIGVKTGKYTRVFISVSIIIPQILQIVAVASCLYREYMPILACHYSRLRRESGLMINS